MGDKIAPIEIFAFIFIIALGIISFIRYLYLKRKRSINRIIQIPESIKRIFGDFHNNILWEKFATIAKREDLISLISDKKNNKTGVKKQALYSLLTPFSEWNIFNWKHFDFIEDADFIKELDKKLHPYLIFLLDTFSKEIIKIGKKIHSHIHESNNYATLDLNSYNSLNGYFKCLITLLPLLDNDDDINKIIEILERTAYHHHSFHGHDGYKNLLMFFNDKNIDEKYKKAIDENLRKKILEEKNSDQKEKWLGFDSILSFYYKFITLNIQSINKEKQYNFDLLAKQIKFLLVLKKSPMNIIDCCMEKQILKKLKILKKKRKKKLDKILTEMSESSNSS